MMIFIGTHKEFGARITLDIKHKLQENKQGDDLTEVHEYILFALRVPVYLVGPTLKISVLNEDLHLTFLILYLLLYF